MARLQSSFAMSAAFCSMATIVRPESSTTAPVSCCPFGVGANGTMVPALSGAYALITLTPAHDGCRKAYHSLQRRAGENLAWGGRRFELWRKDHSKTVPNSAAARCRVLRL